MGRTGPVGAGGPFSFDHHTLSDIIRSKTVVGLHGMTVQVTVSRRSANIVCQCPPHGRQGLAPRRPGDGRGDGERRAVDDWLRRRSTVAVTLIAG
jgi:hypothetical protein